MMIFLAVSLLILVAASFSWFTFADNRQKEPSPPAEATEDFVKTWLQNENGTYATYIQQGEELDEDLVKGRESLAETVGLWMEYAVKTENENLFDEHYHMLQTYFLEDDGFVNWKVTEDGESDVSTNAFIDDIRIAGALIDAVELWEKEEYRETASLITSYLNRHNIRNGVFTDFYEKEDEYASSIITLSYIEADLMEKLEAEAGLDTQAVSKTISLLTEAPEENGFYPKSYDTEEQEYVYDEETNIVDQAITAYHHAAYGGPSEELLQFIKQEMDDRGLVHGMYDKDTKEPAVDYESPAVYGFLILYALESEEKELAQEIFDRMREFKISDPDSDYYGGYGVTEEDTHIFDNLVPMIAEARLKREQVSSEE